MLDSDDVTLIPMLLWRTFIMGTVSFCHAGGPPACSTNLSTGAHIEPNDFLEFGCSVNYSGNWRPTVKCLPNVAANKETHQCNQSERIDYTFQQRIQALEVMKSINLTCMTYFDINGSCSAQTTDRNAYHFHAENTPNYTFIWTSNVPVLCEYKRPIWVNY
jgi:hypothetical protein